MVNQQTLQGNWNELKGKLREKWGQLTNDDLQTAHGNVDQLIGLIQRKTGEARTGIEQFLEQATANGSSTLGQAAESAREYAHQAMETVQERSGAPRQWGQTLATASRHTIGAPDRAPLDCRRLLSWSNSYGAPVPCTALKGHSTVNGIKARCRARLIATVS